MEPVSYAEVNASHQAGDLFAMATSRDTQKDPPPPSGDQPPAGDPPTGDPPAADTPVNWEERYKATETEFTKKEQDYQAKLKDYEARTEELSKKAPPSHKDSDLSRLEVLKAESPEKFALYTQLLFGKPKAADLWKMDFLSKNPEYAEQPEIVEDLLQDAFSAYFDPDADTESREYKVAAAKLEIAGNQIKAQKMAEFKAIAVNDPQEAVANQQKEREALAKSWEIPFTELSKTPLKVSQKIALDDKSEIAVDFGLQPEDNKKYSEAMGLFILHNNLKPSAESAEKARNYATGEIIREKFPEILKAVLQKDRKEQWDAFQKSRNNNRPFAPTNTANDGKKSSEQSIMEMLEHGETYVPNS